MKVLIIIYILMGIIVNIFGPFARYIKTENLYTKLSEAPNYIKWTYIIIIRLFFFLVHPYLYIQWIKDYFNPNKVTIKKQKRQKKNFLYFSNLASISEINCRVCGFTKSVLNIIFQDDDSIVERGYQCQKCGEFSNKMEVIQSELVKKCVCGGKLDREKPIFCPKCKKKKFSIVDQIWFD